MHGNHEKPTQLQRKGDGEAWLFEKSLCVSVCVLWGGSGARDLFREQVLLQILAKLQFGLSW